MLFNITLKVASLALISVLLSACSSLYSEPPVGEEPSPLNFSREAQFKLSSTSHWNRVAEDMARRSLDQFETDKVCVAGDNRCLGNFGIEINSNSTYFSDIFETQLTSALVEDGLFVIHRGQPDYRLLVDIKVATFDRSYLRRIDAPFRLFGPNGFLDKTGIWTIKDDGATSTQLLRNREVGFSWAKDTHNNSWVNNPDEIPNTEIVITFSIIDSTRNYYLARITDSYYWNANSRFLREIRLGNSEGISGSTGTSTSMKVVGDCTNFRCETPEEALR